MIVASWSCLSFPGGVAALLAALEMLVGAVAVSNSSSSQYEWVELESQGSDVFDILVEAR